MRPEALIVLPHRGWSLEILADQIDLYHKKNYKITIAEISELKKRGPFTTDILIATWWRWLSVGQLDFVKARMGVIGCIYDSWKGGPASSAAWVRRRAGHGERVGVQGGLAYSWPGFTLLSHSERGHPMKLSDGVKLGAGWMLFKFMIAFAFLAFLFGAAVCNNAKEKRARAVAESPEGRAEKAQMDEIVRRAVRQARKKYPVRKATAKEWQDPFAQ